MFRSALPLVASVLVLGATAVACSDEPSMEPAGPAGGKVISRGGSGPAPGGVAGGGSDPATGGAGSGNAGAGTGATGTGAPTTYSLTEVTPETDRVGVFFVNPTTTPKQLCNYGILPSALPLAAEFAAVILNLDPPLDLAMLAFDDGVLDSCPATRPLSAPADTTLLEVGTLSPGETVVAAWLAAGPVTQQVATPDAGTGTVVFVDATQEGAYVVCYSSEGDAMNGAGEPVTVGFGPLIGMSDELLLPEFAADAGATLWLLDDDGNGDPDDRCATVGPDGAVASFDVGATDRLVLMVSNF